MMVTVLYHTKYISTALVPIYFLEDADDVVKHFRLMQSS